MKRLLYRITPQTVGQRFLAYVVWLAAFEAIFFFWLWIFGVMQTGMSIRLGIVGLLTCIPFLIIALKMLTLHLAQHRRIAAMARTDLLTNLPGRRPFYHETEATLPSPGAILMVADIDHFKRINDSYGHAFGDQVLKSVARHLRPVIPGSYRVARIGGEEFGLFLLDVDVDHARDIGEVICSGIRVREPVSGQRLHITLSIGGTVAGPHDEITELLRRADEALYRAKDEGRARMIFDTDPPSNSVQFKLVQSS